LDFFGGKTGQRLSNITFGRLNLVGELHTKLVPKKDRNNVIIPDEYETVREFDFTDSVHHPYTMRRFVNVKKMKCEPTYEALIDALNIRA